MSLLRAIIKRTFIELLLLFYSLINSFNLYFTLMISNMLIQLAFSEVSLCAIGIVAFEASLPIMFKTVSKQFAFFIKCF